MDCNLVYDDETLDDLLLGNLRIIQKKQGFRFGLDAVLLAHFVTLKKGDKVLDLGTGTGIIPLLLTTRAQGLQIVGVELQDQIAEMANRSVRFNGLAEQIKIVPGDARDISRLLSQTNFSLVTANPPYWSHGDGRKSSRETKAISRHEISCTFAELAYSASRLLNNGGRFAFIQRAERLGEIMETLHQNRLVPRRLRLVHSHLNRSAKLFLLEARKMTAADLQVLPPLIIYSDKNKYSTEILSWYGKEEMPGDT